MTEKLYNRLHYHEGYDVYNDHEDYANKEVEEQTSKLFKSSINDAAWSCSICTNVNSQSFLSCDICGVFRDAPGIFDRDSAEKVNGKSMEYEASIMAKSLLSQLPIREPKVGMIFDGLLFCEKGHVSASLNNLRKTFLTPSCNYPKHIDPFKFDTPSPDDIVSAGKSSSRTSSKAISLPSASMKASSNAADDKSTIKPFHEDEVPESSFASTCMASRNEESANSSARDEEDMTQMLDTKFRRLKLDKKSAKSKIRKANSDSQYKPEKWMFVDQEQGTLSQLNLAIVGHVDSGKSTLSGKLLHLLGQISKKEMHKYEKEAKEKGKGSFAYAWALDESAEERDRGVTMTVAVAYFVTKKFRVVLLDSPGHQDFVPSMVSGATQADAAILVVDASVGSFEAGMGYNGVGQTKEHAQLVRSFGVEQIIIAVNKMDLVDFSKERFDDIKLQLSQFLRSCGFKESLLIWVPLSAMENQNLLTTASDIRLSSWYDGYCLLDAIDSLQPPNRDVLKPLLLPICDVLVKQSLGQVAVCGKIETGAIRSGFKVLVMPSGDLATIRTIERDSCTCSSARAGDNVILGLHGVDAGNLMRGGVLCHPDFPVMVASKLELKILVLDTTTPILIGSQVELYVHHAKGAARIVKLLSVLDQKTGKVSKKAPRILTSRQSAIIEVALDGEICVEEYTNCRSLGRVILRALGSTIAVGIVTHILELE